jgi:chorismate mutase/GNAT superfamily N-acetyltransferase
MKQPEACESIDDIRTCIDHIDKSIIDQLVSRSAYVTRASAFKKTIADVRAADRVRAMMQTRRAWAEQSSIDSDFIEHLFNDIVRFFTSKESIDWQEENCGQAAVTVSSAAIDDAQSILSLQKRAFIQEAERNGGDYNIPPLVQTLPEMQRDFSEYTILKATDGSQTVGSVRAKQIQSTCHIGRLVVEPIFPKRGIGRLLMKSIEERFTSVTDYELFTGAKSIDNIGFYNKLGYVTEDEFGGPDDRKFVWLRKKIHE